MGLKHYRNIAKRCNVNLEELRQIRNQISSAKHSLLNDNHLWALAPRDAKYTFSLMNFLLKLLDRLLSGDSSGRDIERFQASAEHVMTSARATYSKIKPEIYAKIRGYLEPYTGDEFMQKLISFRNYLKGGYTWTL